MISDQQLLVQLHKIGKHHVNGIVFNTSNVLLCQNNWPINPQYQLMYTQILGGQIIPFRNATDAISKNNKWVTTQTQGLITNLLTEKDIDTMTKVVLVNTVYFKAKWADPFKHEQTYKGKFTGLSGQFNTNMMQNCPIPILLKISH